jgi:bifunctional non-homologous end joining protein LigD
MLDGELVAVDERGAPDFAAPQSAVQRRATGGLLFYVFDLVARGGADLRDRPLLPLAVRAAPSARRSGGSGSRTWVWPSPRRSMFAARWA